MPGQIVVFGPFEFDTGSGSLTKHSVRVRLQNQSRIILGLLVEEPGKLVSRETLRASLWPTVHVDFDRSLNTAVGRLRRTLGEEYGQRIKLRVKEGYWFDAVVTRKEQAAEQVAKSVVPTRSRPVQRWLSAALATVFISSAAALYVRSTRTPLPVVTHITQITNDGRAKAPYLASDGERVYLNELTGGTLRLFQIPRSGGTPISAATSFAGEWPDPLDTYPERGEVLVALRSGLVTWSPTSNTTRRLSGLSCDFAKWSPDHRRIACAVDGSLSLLDADGSHERVVNRIAAIQGLTWTPDGHRVRYSGRTRPGDPLRLREFSTADNSDAMVSALSKDEILAGVFLRNTWLYISARDHNVYASRRNEQPAALTHGPAQLFSLETDGTGNTLYAMGQTRRGELFRYESGKGVWMPFLDGLSADCLAWSKRDDTVAYVSYPQRELWRMKADGSDALQLTTAPVRVYHPNWSPSGSEIAYEALREGEVWRIQVIGRDGGSPAELTPGMAPGLPQRDPAWSPDGRVIAFASTDDASPPDQLGLYVVDLRTKRVRRLPGSDQLLSPRWAPDQSGLAALTRKHEVVFYDLKTGRARVLTAGHKAWPQWSRDGRRICFLDGVRQKIECVEREGGAAQEITSVPFAITGNVFSSAWDYNFWSGFMPDGTPLVLRDRDHSELYALNLSWR